MYKVEISPTAKNILQEYAYRCARDNGEECAFKLLDSYDAIVSLLENTPLIGCGRLKYIPTKYRVQKFWPHLWFVFQVKKTEQCVKIEYIIDDRQNYGEILQ